MNSNNKIFCIGKNKTGTSSMGKALADLGFKVGNQQVAEMLLPAYYKGNFNDIIKYCNSATAFQDVPFSCPEMYKHLDVAFPNSKFILLLRDSPEQWYESMVNFYTFMFGRNNKLTNDNLKNAVYRTKTWVYDHIKYIYNTPDDDLLNKEKLIEQYNKYNNDVIDYFKDKPDKLLIINLSQQDSYKQFCDFLGVVSENDKFPWLGKLIVRKN